jgi:hypothetical protein
MPTKTRRTGGTDTDPAPEVVQFQVKGDERIHWGSRNAKLLVDGLADGTAKILEEVATGAPTATTTGDAAESGTAGH